MSERRRKMRLHGRSMTRLADTLGEFYAFLAKQPQPTREEVRGKFRDLEIGWECYCDRHGLSDAYKIEFNRQVSLIWSKRSKEEQA